MDGTEDQCGTELWLDDVNDASFFYCDIPPMPDFPCMSSSSSSSSTPAPVKPTAGSSSTASTASSSSSAASWAVIKSDGDDDAMMTMVNNKTVVEAAAAPSVTLSSTTQPPNIDQDECMDVMENLSYIDQLLDSNDFFDPSSIFQSSVPEDHHHHQLLYDHDQEQSRRSEIQDGIQTDQSTTNEPICKSESDDLASVFLEWLKMNKDSISAEDLRKVKIKKSTIECAARRLGGGREGMKQLLKLILEWVQNNHLLQKRRLKLHSVNPAPINPNPNAVTNLIPPPTTSSDLNICQPSCWVPPPPAYPTGYMGDPFSMTHNPYQSPPADNYQQQHVLDCVQTWQQPHFPAVPHFTTGSFPDNGFMAAPSFPMYTNQYPYNQFPPPPSDHHQQSADQRLAGVCSSATKEARKKRMARQRRFTSHHRNNHHHHNNGNNSQGLTPNQSGEFIGAENGVGLTAPPPGNSWVYWQSVAAGGGGMTTALPPNHAMLGAEVNAPVMQAAPAQPVMNYQPDRRQGLMKTEKNLRFLLQKVLKQSDVGNLGRIVLPKKEAETHLPELEARDGISIAMEDIGTSRVWNMRYRFWPNNKSRMYLLENTGEFVRANGLQEGDFIVIYSDVKCGKYLIRGVKVRQSGSPAKLSETGKRSGKTQRNQHNSIPPAPVNK